MSEAKWTGTFTPKKHQRVNVRMNGLGVGRIAGFFEECGFQGVIVKLEDAPDWHKRANNGDPHAWVFGREIEEA